MSEQLSTMLERAVGQAPGSRLTGEQMVAAGRARVRRRRAVGVGSAVGALALAGAVWLGVGDGPLGSPQVSPASLTWDLEEGQSLTLMDHVTEGGLSSAVVTRTATGTSATLVVDGQEEEVVGRTTTFGAQSFVGEEVTVLVWDHPAGADGVDVVPVRDDFGSAGPALGDDDLWYAVVYGADQPPRDLLFHDERSVWTASGQVAETRVVGDGSVEKRVFWVEEHALAGVLDHGVMMLDPGWSLISVEQRPWWRGGGSREYVLARLPEEATLARLVTTAPGQHVDGDPVVDTVALGDSAFALASLEVTETDEQSQYAADLQWSVNGARWQDREAGMIDREGLGGIDLRRSGAALLASREGTRLEEVTGLGDRLWAWRDLDGETIVLVAQLPDAHPTADLHPVVRWTSMEAAQVSLAPQFVVEDTTVDVDGDELPALRLEVGEEELLGAVLVNSLVSEGTVRVLGGEPSDPALPDLGEVQVSAAADVEHWAIWTDAEMPGIVDGPALTATPRGDDTWDLVARLPEGSVGDPVLVPAQEGMTVQEPMGEVTQSGGVRWWSLTLQAPGRDDIRDALAGLDTDGDGSVDLPLTVQGPTP